ncbi:MAG: DUF881 domain-containing protein [Jatrophihabitans sp.]|nr:MAG: DUF881 domain-containing protein [Jatrophihabitans sp.]
MSEATVPRSRGWRVAVPVACLAAGLAFGVSAHESGGTDLRPPSTGDLAGLVRHAEAQVKDLDRQATDLQRQVSAATEEAGHGNAAVGAAQARVTPMLAPAGLTAAAGPGITVVLDDAPSGTSIVGVDPNQLVVHQSDLQAVVNALWAGGAEAMSVAGQRLIATSAVRCVGNTLLLNGEVYSPPFRVAAIGPYRTMAAALDASPGVNLFKQAASYYGLGYTVAAQRVEVPAYTGTVALSYARAAR